jgi:hypothetical protein
VSLSFLGPKAHGLTLITDGSGPRQLHPSRQIVTARDTLRVDLLPRGGFVARLTAAK